MPRRQSGRILRQRADARSWAKNGFARVLITGGAKRDARIADVRRFMRLMDKRKAPDVTRRLATVLLSPDYIGRPLATTPGVPAERVKLLRDAFNKALTTPELVAEAKTRNWELEPVTGEELETIGKRVMTQPPTSIERMKKILATVEREFNHKEQRSQSRCGGDRQVRTENWPHRTQKLKRVRSVAKCTKLKITVLNPS